MALSSVCGADPSWESFTFDGPKPELFGMGLDRPQLAVDEFAVGLPLPTIDVSSSSSRPPFAL